MRRPLLALALVLLAPGHFLGAQIRALVREVSGNVEMREVGEEWTAARSGMSFSVGATISTGFDSAAVLELGGSVLQVKQLTRLTLEELAEKTGTIKTELYIRVGKVRAEVKSTEGLRTDFKLRSPLSTASVRGTSFEYDGEKLVVFQGSVLVANPVGQTTSVAQGEESTTVPNAPPASPQQRKETVTTVSADTRGPAQPIATQVEVPAPSLLSPAQAPPTLVPSVDVTLTVN